MAKKIVFIHLFFGFIAFGIYHYHLEGPDLVWNMFLALLALDFSLFFLLYRAKNGKVWKWSFMAIFLS